MLPSEPLLFVGRRELLGAAMAAQNDTIFHTFTAPEMIREATPSACADRLPNPADAPAAKSHTADPSTE
jgi:hypothetical protein